MDKNQHNSHVSTPTFSFICSVYPADLLTKSLRASHAIPKGLESCHCQLVVQRVLRLQ